MAEEKNSNEKIARYILVIIALIFSSIGFGSILSSSISILSLIKTNLPQEIIQSLLLTLYGGFYLIFPSIIIGIIIWIKQRKKSSSFSDLIKKINKINLGIIIIAFIVLIIMTIILVKKMAIVGGML